MMAMDMRKLLVVLLMTLFPVLAFAQGRTVYELGLKPPKLAESAQSKVAKEAFADLAAERLRRRLTAAGIKEFELSVTDPATLRLETGVEKSSAWMEALIASPGKFELLPLASEDPPWLELARTIPEGVEIRGMETPYVWSADRAKLTSWLRRIATGKLRVELFPEDGGFRTISLQEAVATESAVRSVKVESTRGSKFVRVVLDPRLRAQLAARAESGVERFAMVLDGELIGFGSFKELESRGWLRLAPPPGAVSDSRELVDDWVHQVAGRLAAPMPVPVAVLEE